MNVRQAIAVGALSLIGSAVYAATGDAADYSINREIQNPSAVPRAQIRADVRQARAEGQLRAAGEAETYAAVELPRTSIRARADVKAEVLAARAAGELVPAGEGDVVAHAGTHGGAAGVGFASRWFKQHSGQ